MEEMITPNTIFTYVAFDVDKEDAYYIYDPRTGKHYEVSKDKYDEVMKHAHAKSNSQSI